MSESADAFERPSAENIWADIDLAVASILDASEPWAAYDRACDVGELVGNLMMHPGYGLVYVLWANLTDLYEYDRRGIVPPDGAHEVLQRVARDWLNTPATDRAAFADHWCSQDLFQIVVNLGYKVSPRPDPRTEEPWRGHWDNISWATEQIGTTHSAYAAAQRVLHEIEPDPVTWRTGRGTQLRNLLSDWDTMPDHRDTIESMIVAHLHSLTPEQIPALKPPTN